MVDWSKVFNGLGLTLNVAGAVVAGYALAATWEQYGTGPVFPPLTRALDALAALWRRLTPWRKRGTTVALSGALAIGTAVSMRATGRVGISADAPLEQKVAALIAAYNSLGSEVESNRQASDKAHADLTNRLDQMRDALQADHARLEKLAKEIAVSDVRPQLLALVLVALGSILQALPNLFCLSPVCK